MDRLAGRGHHRRMGEDPQALFSRAEQAYRAGRNAEAIEPLRRAEAMVPGHPAVPHLRGIVARRLGNLDEARSAFERARRLAPADPQIVNNHGNLLSDLGELEPALEAYRRAAALAPGFVQAELNAAITLHQLSRLHEAHDAAARVTGLAPASAAAWTARAAVERDLGVLGAAAASIERALAADPGHVRAVVIRAQLARLRGEAEAGGLYARARALAPADRGLLIEEAELRAAEGAADPAGALAQAVAADPLWTAGQEALARIRWEADAGTDHLANLRGAVRSAPREKPLWGSYLALLADADEPAAAADAAREAQRALGGDADFALAEAAFASMAGDDARAERLFAALPAGTVDRPVHEARHRIRTGDLDAAEALLSHLRSENPDDIVAWALTEIVWRAASDPRAAWLSADERLACARQLALDADTLARLVELLRGLHRLKARPLGQSLRHGTQTRHRLFDRPEPGLAELKGAVAAALEQWRAALPPADPAHPLLRHRDAALAITGSWSVRLTGSGHHVSHVHPAGTVSSACYLALPALDAATGEGWLELGRPPANLRLELEPLRTIQPAPGRLALFPSFLFHGTRPFREGERLTVAFDAVPARTR